MWSNGLLVNTSKVLFGFFLAMPFGPFFFINASESRFFLTFNLRGVGEPTKDLSLVQND